MPNPCDTQYAVDIEDIPLSTVPRCSMCGAITDIERRSLTPHGQTLKQMEHVYRLCEYILWCRMTHKGIGSIIRVISAKVMNPSASLSQIGAAVGLSKRGVHDVTMRIKRNLPEIYGALFAPVRSKGDAESEE